MAVDLVRRGDVRILRVETYDPWGTREPGVDEFRRALHPHGVPVTDVRRGMDPKAPERGTLVLHAGWQFLTPTTGPGRSVVLHDSVLPRLRGFNPTVTALILGHPEIGVTALLPTEERDSGPILAQHSVRISHPIRIEDALEALRPCYLAAASDVIRASAVGPLTGSEQDEESATYSVWRDEWDYALDLRQGADRVVRTVLALGHPYRGAAVAIAGQEVRIMDAEDVEDVEFEQRDVGKVWRLDERGPVVICGRGMVRLTKMVDPDGRAVTLDRLRTRIDAWTPPSDGARGSRD